MLATLLATATGMPSSITDAIWFWPVVIIVGAFMGLILMWSKLYVRASADMALVRTGFGGMKIRTDGGMLVFPIFHELLRIHLATKTLEVKREGEHALITKDPIRADVAVHFYIRIEKEKEQVERAARSLGNKTVNPRAIQELVDAKLVGALRSVAATKLLKELHEDRQSFADAVETEVKADLEHNGLTLESVSIVSFDQTDKEELNADNVFDAQGLKLIEQTTAKAQREQNLAIREKEVGIHQDDMNAAIKKKQFDAEEAASVEHEQTKIANTVQEQKAEREMIRIAQEQEVRDRDIARDEAIQAREIAKAETLQEREVAREQAIDLAEREKLITVAQKQSQVEAEEAARLHAVALKEEAAQAVITVELRAAAEREKQVTIINQEAQSEQAYIERQKAADASAYEVERKAKAAADAAQLEAAAIERLAEANLAQARAEAEGNTRLIEALNSKKIEVIVAEALRHGISQMPEIVREAMKPAEKISDIRVLNVSGAGVTGNGTGSNGGHGGAGKVVGAFMEAGAAFPMFREMLRFAGIDAENMSLGEIVRKGLHSTPEVRNFIEKHIPAEVREELTGGEAADEEPAPGGPSMPVARKSPAGKTRTRKKPTE